MAVYRLDDQSFVFPSPEEADDEHDGLLAKYICCFYGYADVLFHRKWQL
jgi:hypothetical protein